MAVGTLRTRHPRAVVAERLRRIARVRARFEGLRSALESEAAAVRRRYESRMAGLRNRIDQQRAELERYCRAERDNFLPPGRKSLITQFGEVAFRRSEASVKVLDGLGEEEVCRRLRARGLASLVRVKEGPDKSAVRRAVREARLRPEELEECGLRLVDGADRFYCKVWQDALVDVGGENT